MSCHLPGTAASLNFSREQRAQLRICLPPRQHRQWTSNFTILTLHAFGLARAGCPERGHGRF